MSASFGSAGGTSLGEVVRQYGPNRRGAYAMFAVGGVVPLGLSGFGLGLFLSNPNDPKTPIALGLFTAFGLLLGGFAVVTGRRVLRARCTLHRGGVAVVDLGRPERLVPFAEVREGSFMSSGVIILKLRSGGKVTIRGVEDPADLWVRVAAALRG